MKEFEGFKVSDEALSSVSGGRQVYEEELSERREYLAVLTDYRRELVAHQCRDEVDKLEFWVYELQSNWLAHIRNLPEGSKPVYFSDYFKAHYGELKKYW